MTVIVQTPFNQHVANGVTTVFGFTFQLLDAGDLEVSVDGVLVGGYSISGLGVQAGGSITFVSPPANLAVVDIRRVIPLARSIDYQQNGDLPSNLIDLDLDRIWQAMQDAVFLNTLAVTLPLGDPSVPMVLPGVAERASRWLAFDSNGDAIAALSSPSSVPVTAYMETVLAAISAAAARTLLGAATAGSVGSSGLTMATARMLARTTAGAGAVEELTAAQVRTFLSLAAIATSGSGADITTGNIAADRIKSALNASGSAPIYAPRAWVTFNGAGTVGILAEGNVSSVTDNGVGDYTVNFSTAMPDANYAPIGSCQRDGGTSLIDFQISPASAPTTSACRIEAYRMDTRVLADSARIAVAFFR